MKMLEGESLGDLVWYWVILVIYLGVVYLVKIVEELLLYYGVDCLVVVIYWVSWFDQEQVCGIFGDILFKVVVRNFCCIVLILVGEVLVVEGFVDFLLYCVEY